MWAPARKIGRLGVRYLQARKTQARPAGLAWPRGPGLSHHEEREPSGIAMLLFRSERTRLPECFDLPAIEFEHLAQHRFSIATERGRRFQPPLEVTAPG